MAVIISALDLAIALRVEANPDATLVEPQLGQMTRLLASSTASVDDYAPNAPEAIANEAVIRLAGWLYDAVPGRVSTDPMGASGARALLAPFRDRTIRFIEPSESGSDVQVMIPSTGGLTSDQVTALINQLVPGFITQHSLPNAHHVPPNVSNYITQQQATDLIAIWARQGDTSQIPADKLTLAPGEGGTTTIVGTKVFVQTTEPTGGTYALDDIWIRDVTANPWQIYKWTGTVWAVTFTAPDLADMGVELRARNGTLPTPNQALYDSHAVAALDGRWYYIQLTGHETSTNEWTWADLNDGQTDLAQWRGVVSQNPFSIQNPQALDWSYVSNEHRWVRYVSSTWQYQPAPANFNNNFRSQHAAERGGLTTVGRYIFSSSKHQMRIIRSYTGNVPGPPTYAWVVFEGQTLDIEDWAYRDGNGNSEDRIQTRKLAEFPQGR